MTKTPSIGDNSRLTPEQEQSLFFNCVDRYEKSLKKKKEADASFKGECKTIKADLSTTGYTVEDIKDAIKMRDDGSEEFAAKMRRQAKIASWLGLPLGHQASFLDGDPRPAEEKAYEEGHAAGLASKDCKSPYDGVLGQKWIAGWHDGQAIRATEFREELERNNEAAKKSTNAKPAEPRKRGRPKKDKTQKAAEDFGDALDDAKPGEQPAAADHGEAVPTETPAEAAPAPDDDKDLRPPFLVEKTDSREEEDLPESLRRTAETAAAG